MRSFGKWLLIATSAAGAFFGVRALIIKYGLIVAAVVTVWNDPQVQKLRKRAVKKARRAMKAAEKTAAKAAKHH
ncbi:MULTISPECIES: hypothetical protein [unclassified Microbacterium]|uniref:hypothetical protein n=1 Tax=unclassified Microbacterium TaxID=2609290 RepID=UPI0037460B0A